MDSAGPIGVFDSGVGGISVLRELVRQMPGERFLYFGDSANAPYGGKTTEQIRSLAFAAAQRLLQQGAKALVVACNTATAAAIEELREKYPETIVVGVEPALKVAAERFPGGKIGVMATPVTLREEKFARQLARFSEEEVYPIPVTGLVKLIEEGKGNSPEAEALLRDCLAPYIGKLDAVVLGCTHYPFAAKTIGKILGEKTALFDGGVGTASQTRRRLLQEGLLQEGAGEIVIENSLPDAALIQRCYTLLKQQ